MFNPMNQWRRRGACVLAVFLLLAAPGVAFGQTLPVIKPSSDGLPYLGTILQIIGWILFGLLLYVIYLTYKGAAKWVQASGSGEEGSNAGLRQMVIGIIVSGLLLTGTAFLNPVINAIF